ncbi:uncharacterized protein AMSG_11800 [Thecamonas trahens ATCC 50062]|uniref:Fibronectin type III domain-containing protein n=1 Tax=Thecamonas trahens ATCC 50062 TaxID=461836 RepID=A0A0L0D7P8_THETB|nr:hypothetical protein AMSG_11800 [Thecamonas trahens ATCC 50062]KNC48081.1 hypothetical protein AMSG_11800 [Thecamonas trahens ATCC 50062]|eukprot:XP_013759118.1 hypothetical protein AMSG_11800 [Thecamonas trahens ATCC 50062]
MEAAIGREGDRPQMAMTVKGAIVAMVLLLVQDAALASCNVDYRLPAATTLASGSQPHGVVAAVLDSGTPFLDVAYIDFGVGSVMVMTRTGGGGWNVPASIDSTRTQPRTSAVGDVDGDGSPDLIVTFAAAGSNAIVLYRNIGWDATFPVSGLLQSYAVPVGGDPDGVAIGDINGDSLVDVVFSLAIADVIGAFMGTGPGTLAAAPIDLTSALPAAPSQPSQVSIVDVDVDGINDVVYVEAFGDRVIVMAGRPDIASTLATSVAVVDSAADTPFSFDVGDVDADSLPDIVVALFAEDKIALYVNLGDLAFSSRITLASEMDAPLTVAIADLNNDGAVDVVFCATFSDVVRWIPGNGAGGFTAAPQRIDDALSGARNVIVHDFDSDGALDVMAAAFFGGEVKLYTFDPSLSPFPYGRRLISNTANGARGVDAADFDGDGATDVVSASSFDNSIVVYYGDGTGYHLGNEVSVSGVADGVESVVAADYDGDGWTDIASASSGSGAIEWWRNIGKRNWAPSPMAIGTCDGAMKMSGGDFNNDGLPDLVAGCADAPSPSISAYINGDDGSTWTVQVVYSTPLIITNMDTAVGDIDDDGFVDVLFVASSVRLVGWASNAGGTGFLPPTTIDTLAIGFTIAAALCDVDDDGDLDVISAVANGGGSAISLYTQTAPGTISSTPTDLGGSYNLPYSISCRDASGDGFPDVAVASYSSDQISWLRNRGLGDGTFEAQEILTSTSIGAYRVKIVDVNNDGFNDLLCAGNDDDTIESFIQRPVLNATPMPAALPPHPAAVPLKVTDIYTALNTASQCTPQRIELAAGSVVVGGCSADGYLTVPAGAMWTIAGPAGVAPALRPRIDCGSAGGVMFEVGAGAQLKMTDVVLAGATVGSQPSAVTGLRVSGLDATLRLERVLVTGFSSQAASELQAMSGIGGSLAAVDGGRLDALDSAFDSNVAKGVGGAVALVGSAPSAHFTNCSFVANTALGGGGGAVAVLGSSASVVFDSGSTLASNSAPYGSGGGLLVTETAEGAMVAVNQTQIDDNVAGKLGGGVAVFEPLGCSVRLGAGALVSNNEARAGGGVSAVHAGYYEPERTDFVAADLPRAAAASLPDHSVVVLGIGAVISGNSARYGGAFFGCGAHIDASAAVASAPPTASVGGGVGFFCVDANNTLPSPALWLSAPAGGVAGASAGGYGDMYATPPVALAVEETTPGVTASGMVFGRGTLSASDGLGQQVVDAGLSLGVAPLDSHVIVTGAERGVAFVAVDGLAHLELISAAADGSLLPLDASLKLSLVRSSEETADPEVSTSVTMRITACPRGLGSDTQSALASNVLVCSPCDEGSYSDVESIEPCRAIPACPAFSLRPGSANTTHLVACMCKAGTWSPEAPLVTACRPCPVGAVCVGGGERPKAMYGWKLIDTATFRFAECPIASACRGGFVEPECGPTYNPDSYLCRQCAANSYRSRDGGCVKCPQAAISRLYLFVGLAAGIAFGSVIVIAAATRAIKAETEDDALLMSESQAAARIAASASAMTLAARNVVMHAMRRKPIPHALGVAFVYLQVLGILADAPFNWPESPVGRILRTANVANIDLGMFATDCTIKDFGTRYAFSVLAPAAFFCLVGLFVAGIKSLPRCFSCVADTHLDRVSGWTLGGRLLFSFGPLLYIPLSRAALVFFDCTKLPNGKYYLDANLDEECGSEAWLALLPLAILAVIAYVVALPALFGVVLWRNRKSLSSTEVLMRYGPIYTAYRQAYFWYEVALLLKRLGVVATALFFSRVDVWLFTLLVGIFMVSGAFQLKHEPFFFPLHNQLETRLNGAVLVLLGCGVLFWADKFYNRMTYLAIVVIAVASIGFSVVLLVTTSFREVRATFRYHRRRRRTRQAPGEGELDINALSIRDEVFLSLLARHVSDLENPALSSPLLDVQSRFETRRKPPLLPGLASGSSSELTDSSSGDGSLAEAVDATRMVTFVEPVGSTCSSSDSLSISLAPSASQSMSRSASRSMSRSASRSRSPAFGSSPAIAAGLSAPSSTLAPSRRSNPVISRTAPAPRKAAS